MWQLLVAVLNLGTCLALRIVRVRVEGVERGDVRAVVVYRDSGRGGEELLKGRRWQQDLVAG
jgi:hypothetical protein